MFGPFDAKLALMRVTYVAWNGEPYPWPPPEGWYKAVDGRWWAPGSGPEPHRVVDHGRDSTEMVSSTESAGMAVETDRSANQESLAEDLGPDQQTVLTTGNRNTLPRYEEVIKGLAEAADQQAGTSDHTRHRPTRQARQTKTRTSFVLGWFAGFVGLLLLGAAGTFVAIRTDGTDQASPSPTTRVFGEAAAPTTLSAGNPTPSEPPPTTTPPVSDQSTNAPLSSEAAGTATTTTIPDDDALVAAWRADLADRNIDSTALSDADIIDFGKSFCVFAVVSADSAEFDDFRNRAQTGVAGSLTELQLNAAIDAAVTRFCPEDASRLGIAP